MTSQENKPPSAHSLTPFESAQSRMAEFAENWVQSSMWFSMAEKLEQLADKDDPQSLADRFAIENFLSTTVQTIPALNAGEA